VNTLVKDVVNYFGVKCRHPLQTRRHRHPKEILADLVELESEIQSRMKELGDLVR